MKAMVYEDVYVTDMWHMREPDSEEWLSSRVKFPELIPITVYEPAPSPGDVWVQGLIENLKIIVPVGLGLLILAYLAKK